MLMYDQALIAPTCIHLWGQQPSVLEARQDQLQMEQAPAFMQHCQGTNCYYATAHLNACRRLET